ncbi:MAG: triose-phosphate isomerase [Cytophagales bacterium]|nr:triose-phosphate isomerase [Cytophagales bacterium]MDW8384175.1 triose-phosphate isomerase [Flammeovirgaceae bacterium]
MRKRIVAGNWKMNTDKSSAIALAEAVKNQLVSVPSNTEVVLCVPFVHISEVKRVLDGSSIKTGAQNCYTQPSGAYTGEVSAPMLRSYGVEYVILGHSERREYFKESNAELAQKVKIALENNLIPIFCVGEVKEERQAGVHISVVERQLEESLFHLSAEHFFKIVIAYEPVWAIGTGLTATTAQAQEMHNAVRQMIAKKYSSDIAERISILYGGSCKPENARELFACADVDGGLIGGASLKASDFVAIVNSF